MPDGIDTSSNEGFDGMIGDMLVSDLREPTEPIVANLENGAGKHLARFFESVHGRNNVQQFPPSDRERVVGPQRNNQSPVVRPDFVPTSDSLHELDGARQYFSHRFGLMMPMSSTVLDESNADGASHILPFVSPASPAAQSQEPARKASL